MSDAANKVSLYAINSILDRVDPLVREIPGVIVAEDPEYLHRMRVASRRLRMALRLLSPQAGMTKVAGFFKLIRSVTRVLGAARDLDVQILWLETFAEGRPRREQPGVCRIALRLAQRRKGVQPRIVKLLSTFTDDPMFKRTLAELRNARLDAEMRGEETTKQDLEQATRVMSLQLDSVIQHASSLHSPDSIDAQHAMRIEVKNLRYAMEIYRDLYVVREDDGNVVNRLDPYIALAKKLQGFLGALHDADVWVERIPEMMEQERNLTAYYFGTPRPFARLSPGYTAVAQDRKAFREAQYETAAQFWRETAGEGEWRDLRGVLLQAYRDMK